MSEQKRCRTVTLPDGTQVRVQGGEPVVKVAQNLRAIVELSTHLLTQAVHTANDSEIVGGDAMVALGPVADPVAYVEKFDEAERRHAEDPDRWPASTIDLEHEDDEMTAVLWSLWYWSGDWRNERDYPLRDRRATIVGEAGFIRGCLDWAWQVLDAREWTAFADDMQAIVRRLENILHDGERSQVGVLCPSCEQPARRLILWHNDRDLSGESDEYRCPDDWNHRWTIRDYRRWVGAVYVAHASALTADDIANQYGIRPGTLRVWVTRGQVAKRGRDHSGRQLYDVAQARQANGDERVAG
jgi:hypothetical protein